VSRSRSRARGCERICAPPGKIADTLTDGKASQDEAEVIRRERRCSRRIRDLTCARGPVAIKAAGQTDEGAGGQKHASGPDST